MGRYEISLKKEARSQMKLLEKSGRRADFQKVLRFLREIGEHPRAGTGQTEHMRHQKEGEEVWSRRVNGKDRFVYEILEEEGLVSVIQVLGHYGDR